MAALRIEQVRKELSDAGWELLSEYKNLDTELKLLCPKKHTITSSLKKWRKKKNCPVCDELFHQYEEAEIVPKQRGKKRVLALDQATKKTGWSIYDGKDLIKCGSFESKGKGEIERISAVKKWVICMLNNWNPDYVFIEDIQLQKKIANSPGSFDGVTTFKVLAHLQGVISNVVFERDIPLYIVLSSVWRKTCGIQGRTKTDQKRSAQLRVKELHKIEVDNDTAEAVCLGFHGAKIAEKDITLIEW